MGYFVHYHLRLRIKPKNFRRALEIFNHLHTDEMLLRHANGGLLAGPPGSFDVPVPEKKWYRWVPNPQTPYTTLSEAFKNWGIVDIGDEMYIDSDTGDFVIEGFYDSKLGQQDFLIEQLAPVLCDTYIEVIGEDKFLYVWRVVNHVFYSETYEPSDSEDEEVTDPEENNRLAL